MRRFGLLLVFLYGCGDSAPEVALQANVTVRGLSQTEVVSLEALVLGPRLSDDTILTCISLLDSTVDPRGGSVETLATAVANVSQGQAVTFTIGAVEEGADRLLYIEALGLGQVLVGRGCAQAIAVQGGETTVVNIELSDI